MSEENRSDEISFLEMFNILRRYKWLVLGLPLVAALLATLLVSFVLHPTWEASAVLEIGQVGQVLQPGQVGLPGQALVEPATNVVTRMMLPSFTKGALASVDINPEQMDVARGFLKTLKATQIKGSELVQIKLRGPSAEMARNLIQGAIASLQKMHSEMMAVTIDRNRKQLQILTEDIKKTSAESELIRKKLLASHNWNTFDATLSATLLQDKSIEMRDMVQRRLMLEEQISPSRSYTTRVVDEIYVSEGPVSPNKPLIIGLAVLLGLFGAIVLALAHNAITPKP